MRAVTRVTRILECVAAAAGRGIALGELAQKCGLDKATTLRIAGALCAAGWLSRSSDSARYRIGAEAWLAGRRGDPMLERLERTSSRHLAALARTSGDTAYLAVRSGLEMVFLHRADGAEPLRARIEIGHRQTVAVGCTGLSWLAAVDADASDLALRELAPVMKALKIDRADLARQVARSRERGYAFSKGSVFFGVPAVGLAVRTPDGEPIAAISLAANAERLTSVHIAKVLPALRVAVAAIERSLRRASTDRRFS